MSTVKGSKQAQMVVVEHRPLFHLLLRIGLLLCFISVGLGSFFYGHSEGVTENDDARAERDQLVLEVETSNSELKLLKQQNINMEQAGVVDKQALTDVQGTILGLREANAQLEEDILFYKQIMSPENNEAGLVIGQVDLMVTEEDNKIRYRFEFKQLATNERQVKGYANISIMGMQDGQEVSFPLRGLSVAEEQLDIELKFKYFQNIEGELLLPEGFEPDKVQILVVSDGAASKTIQKSFGWLVQM